jgi:ABC-type bacteriocin/lantibiotic exporter with double-glycine peptidase domain
MTPHMKIGIAGVVIGLILFLISPWLALVVIGLAIAIPGVAYAMLDSNQKARLKRVRNRRQIGR